MSPRRLCAGVGLDLKPVKLPPCGVAAVGDVPYTVRN